MKFEKRHIKECIQIFNSYANAKEVVFKPLDEERFEALFCSDKYNSMGVVKEDANGEVLGFAFGTVSEIAGYISYIGVRKDVCRRGFGKELFSELTEAIKKENREIKRLDCIFYNPCQLSWFVPNHEPHDHPGVPGVYMKGSGYEFFKACGFYDYAVQNAYYMQLNKFEEREKIKEKKEKLNNQGIEVCFFDKEKHTGFSELFENIKNEGWRKSVMSRLDEKIVVAVKDNVVIGYSGPLSVSKGKRGLFCGIGVHTDFRQYGIGSVIFSELCAGLKGMGAEFMSLFTGDNNPARFVYESTGFELVAKFSCMRKEL
ncbi:MAG: GNAT family N-acetyltransferase [Ruminococcaceae bacterium]|nr:GNAT family N-acetyltransferase [Oscillospiraceae bacterium]